MLSTYWRKARKVTAELFLHIGVAICQSVRTASRLVPPINAKATVPFYLWRALPSCSRVGQGTYQCNVVLVNPRPLRSRGWSGSLVVPRGCLLASSSFRFRAIGCWGLPGSVCLSCPWPSGQRRDGSAVRGPAARVPCPLLLLPPPGR